MVTGFVRTDRTVTIGMEAGFIQGGVIMAYDYSMLFSSLNSSNFYGTSSASLDFTTLSTIKNGSYKKLLNAYYKKESGNTDKSQTDKSNVTGSSKEKINSAGVRDSAASVTDAVNALNKSSLWKKTEKTDESGNKTEEYDKDAIYKSVKSFVDSYNSLVDKTGDSSDTSVLRRASIMVNSTKANKNLLSKVGISIGTDNKLSIDEDEFKKSEMVTAKSLFSGVGSYGKNIQADASMIYGSAVADIAKLSGSTYGSTGAYQYNSFASFNRYL